MSESWGFGSSEMGGTFRVILPTINFILESCQPNKMSSKPYLEPQRMSFPTPEKTSLDQLTLFLDTPKFDTVVVPLLTG